MNAKAVIASTLERMSACALDDEGDRVMVASALADALRSDRQEESRAMERPNPLLMYEAQPRKPDVRDDGIPYCSTQCQNFNGWSGKCRELDAEPDRVCVPALHDMVLELDAHKDASTPAFDEIAAMCGCPKWEYPGQVIRDVAAVVKERDALRERLRIAEAVRDDARLASMNDLMARRVAEADCESLRRRVDEFLATSTPRPGVG